MADSGANNNTTATNSPAVPDYNPSRLETDISTQHQDERTLPLDEALREEKMASHNADETPSTLIQDQYLTADGKEEAEPVEKLEPTSSDDEPSTFRALSARDREALTTIASQTQSFYSARRQSIADSETDPESLERKGTLDGLEVTDEVFDPKSPKFDLKTWIRMSLRLSEEQGLKVKRAGLVFKNVNVSGSGSALNIQGTVGSMFTAPLRINNLLNIGHTKHKQILHDFNGLMKSGELLIVLGRPGSGCSTLLKSITGQMHGLTLEEGSTIHYNGIEQKKMLKEFKGEVIYNQEVDKHFPHLTVGQTLEHAAALRTPQSRPLNCTREQMIKHVTQVVMAIYGLSHTYNTKVGNDFVRGVSGGERKRVSIAEMALAGSMLAAWDNSTRGLDSATALTFVKSLRMTADLVGSSHAIAIYQASQAIYDLFDRAVVLYEGRQIFFGRADKAKDFFERQGWYCPPRQTTGDFLTSVTNPSERQTRKGFENKVPRTPDEFEKYWKNSPEFAELQQETAAYEEEYPIGHEGELQSMREYKGQQQSKHARPKSPFVVSVFMQVKLNTKRAFQRMKGDMASIVAPIASNVVMALIIGSVFYGTPAATAGFQSLGAVLFFAILLSALMAITEINSLYDQRPIVEKHFSYAFYHPSTEAIAGIVSDIPIKFATLTVFNIILYFLAGLRREPSQFFIFFLITYTSTFVMSAVFRTMAAVTKTISQAMALSGVLVLAIVVYTGFVVPVKYMVDWFGWIRWINPVYYAFEILMANEFHGREFACSQFIPAYPDLTGDQFVCSSKGSVQGRTTVNGDTFLAAGYGYYYSHVWRNFGILLAFLFAFMAMYFIAVEINSETSSTAEVLVFRRGHVPQYMLDQEKQNDEEAGAAEKGAQVGDNEEEGDVNVIPPQTDIFTWRDVDYDIPVKEGTRRLLDHVSGYVKPGTLTALMGTSGAGKTTLLDVLAQRVSMGVVSGSMFVNGAPLDESFQRKTGYVQQQDLHLETATVRESLRFSAMLRQPKTVSKKEKYDYVEDVIKMLNMEDFAEAVVGVPGEGLNVEQRKLLTIGVELAAKPKLLLFLDEPTSGLDSQSSWAICSFLRKLADNGQAVLCTIHQPSAILFQEFDRLLFLRKGGKTVYFGEIGEQSRTLLDYFEDNGARKCADDENPAEYMLEVVADENADWVGTWKNSPQASQVQQEIDQFHKEKGGEAPKDDDDPTSHSEFAMPFTQQLYEVTFRVFQQYWRMPSYILAKVLLSGASGLFIGFSFYDASVSLQGMQNVLYSLFMVTTIFSTLVQQIMPLFVTQRSLYEVRERPSKAYSWKAFLMANIVVEIPYQIIAGLIIYATFYYPVVGIQSSERQGLVLLFCVVFLIYASTFAHMCISALPDAQTAGSIVTLLFAMSLIFNGVMQAPDALPGFWIFMYRVSPMTYFVAGMAATMLHGRQVQCSTDEVSIFQPPAQQTCQQYMAPYLQAAPGYLINPDATSDCGYCSVTVADTFLGGVNIYWSERWRNFGLMWVYVVFDIAVAVLVYYLFRVRTGKPGWISKLGAMGKKSKKSTKKDATSQAPQQIGGGEGAEEKKVEDETETSSEEGGSGDERNGIQRSNSWAQGTVDGYLNYNLRRTVTNRRNVNIV